MNQYKAQISRLVTLRNSFGKQYAPEKIQLLNTINIQSVNSKKSIGELYSVLLFLIAYPENKAISKTANQLLGRLEKHIEAHDLLQYHLYNSGITGTSCCAAFSFELIKWLKQTRPADITFNSFEADDAQIQAILSVVMTKTESEIMQDENAEWKGWLKKVKSQEQDLLDQLIAIFDSSDTRPEIKEELWNTLGINVEIRFSTHCSLPVSLIKSYYHRALIRKEFKQPIKKPVQVKLTQTEAEQLVDCGRMILVRKLRELDPISFTDAEHVSYYQLGRGISIVLTGMVPEHRHPIDSYMGYLVFKNGLPVAYAGSWILFDSARIGLNVFADYRGGEAKYIFDQVLQLHAYVYGLKRFTVDPYQLGKANSDGIRSGAFWIYYQAGFRPLMKTQKELASNEELKIKANRKYRSPASVLKILAHSRMELLLKKTAVRFDATDLSLVYAGILAEKYKGNRRQAENNAAKKLAGILQIKNYLQENMNFVLKNWAIVLLGNEKELRRNSPLKKTLKRLFALKAAGSEEEYITGLQKAAKLRIFMQALVQAVIIEGGIKKAPENRGT